jgi:hypothetical protein
MADNYPDYQFLYGNLPNCDYPDQQNLTDPVEPFSGISCQSSLDNAREGFHC